MSLRRKLIAGGLAALVVGVVVYALHKNGYSWKDFETMLRNAPAWIFLLLLVVLPPLGVPLSIFMLAVGARFGYFLGALTACGALVGHHLIAIWLSSAAKGLLGENVQGNRLWKRLERKVGENHGGKLVFLFAFIPGPPYWIKLYLPLAMGVSLRLYLWFSTTAHMIGVFLFVGLGSALLKGNALLVGVFLLAMVGFYLLVKWIRERQVGTKRGERERTA
ncbi:VTT domain-containing protein [Pelagicoccus sp. SDUM812003]|uniref:VTT domain-containing protein n=1 Tax=Pelagicoccus sp. SDUM812003 TaxID=3041267 RepID=UPI00280FF161|nr:VTT domain-containing protein [Pelagicoccus sp. SDUM812003]MDQ8204325.1 VTT domain-containing protein [Pelagicoccus sp. SDUM812003]